MRVKETAVPVGLLPATIHDLPEIVTIERQAFGDPWSADAFVDLLASPHVWFVVAREGARADGAVLGYVVAWFVAGEGEVANLAVAPTYQGRGIGAALLDGVIEESSTRVTTELFLEVRMSNAAARGLYASRGFVEVGRRARYYRAPVEDALVLRRGASASCHSGQ